jgi:hypothetical protein
VIVEPALLSAMTRAPAAAPMIGIQAGPKSVGHSVSSIGSWWALKHNQTS